MLASHKSTDPCVLVRLNVLEPKIKTGKEWSFEFDDCSSRINKHAGQR